MRHRNRLGILALCGLTFLAPASWAAEDPAIQRAIDRGVTYLKGLQADNGTWIYPEIGATALAGLALVECGVVADDPSVDKAANAVRQASLGLTKTYSLSLAILFLDRLGDPADIPLIQSLAVRLLAGQNSHGGWTYDCPPIGEAEVRRLGNLLKQRNQLVGGRELPRALPSGPRDRPPLPKEIQQQLDLINRQKAVRPGAGPGVGPMSTGDNSNTQFAILALWVARRYGIPADAALARVDTRFRTSQHADGGWGYLPVSSGGRGGSTAAMTCAGLLGLAVAHGTANDVTLRTDAKAAKGKAPRDPAKDPAVRAGLLALGTAIDHPQAKRKGRGQVPVMGRTNRGYYFLWSLERVAVAYGLETIGTKDWYAWGSEILLANQDPDGGWHGEYRAAGVDTCFALLFLRRANLAKDLTASLKGRVQDPGEVLLKGGGVGGASLVGKRLQSDIGLAAGPEESGPRKDPTPVQAKNPGAAPPAGENFEAEAGRLSSELVRAPATRQDDLVARLRDSKGVVHTQALAAAIPKLTGETKSKAREALAERLTRMTAATLKEKLQDSDLEVRRAAALACAMKEAQYSVPDLINLLEDPELPVVRAAHAALKSLTTKDFGPEPDATRAERAKAVAAWKAWWQKQSGK